MALATILIGHDIFAGLQGRSLRRRADDCYWVASRKQARPQHQKTQDAEVIGRCSCLLSRGGQAAKIRDDRTRIVVAQPAGIGIGHHDQPGSVAINTVPYGTENIAVRLVAQRPCRREIGCTNEPIGAAIC
jgi:hypothetical protein